MLPATAPPDVLLEPLGAALILRAYSGPFVDHDERNLEGWPDIIVFDDGLIVVNTSADSSFADEPAFVSTQLSVDEFEDLTEVLTAAKLEPLAAGGQRDATFCFDCPTAIIRTDITGDTIEIAAAGLITTGDPSYTANLPYPPSVVAVDRLLNQLAERTRDAGEPYDAPVPVIPIAPCNCG